MALLGTAYIAHFPKRARKTKGELQQQFQTLVSTAAMTVIAVSATTIAAPSTIVTINPNDDARTVNRIVIRITGSNIDGIINRSYEANSDTHTDS